VEKGQLVRLTVDYPNGGSFVKGDVGVIKEIIDNQYAAIDFEEEFHDMHDCDGYVSSGRGWFVELRYLELL
jgi:formylmethanofuran dehydrogenase subunit A